MTSNSKGTSHLTPMNDSPDTSTRVPALSSRKQTIKALADQVAPDRTTWISHNQFYYDDHYRFMRFLTPPTASVLDLGCGIGDRLGVLCPKIGIGVDLSDKAIQIAKEKFPQ